MRGKTTERENTMSTHDEQRVEAGDIVQNRQFGTCLVLLVHDGEEGSAEERRMLIRNQNTGQVWRLLDWFDEDWDMIEKGAMIAA